MDRVLRERVGVGLSDAERYDIRRLFRGSSWDQAFPADRMLPALRGTLSNLGIDLDAQENIHLDVEERPMKSPRAFCAPIEIPDKVMLVIQPQGGPDDWYALFHEAGPHRALRVHRPEPEDGGEAARRQRRHRGVGDALRPPDRRPCLALRACSTSRGRRLCAEGAVQLLFYVRRYCAKLLYEIEFHAAAGPDPDAEPLRRAPRRCAEGRAEPDRLPL